MTKEKIDKFISGNSLDSYKFLGNHKVEYKGEVGNSFAVWAPNAKAVYLVGDFNNWNETSHSLTNMYDSGIWSIFTTDLGEGEIYKYNVVGCDGVSRLKSDPYGTFSELRPKTASVVYEGIDYKWKDKKYLEKKNKIITNNEPMNIYEVHLGSWKRKWDGGFFSFEELYEMIDYAKDMGYTHIELMPITEHPLDMSWGYQTVGYYATTSRHGNPDEFKAFVDKCHENNLGIILDFAYSHFCKDEHGLYRFDGSPQFEYEDPLKAENLGWGTVHFDLGKPEVNSFLLSNVMYWFKEFHVDGIRVDAVSSILYLDYDIGDWRPNKYGGRENIEGIDFLRRLNEVVYENIKNPLIIAEESTSWPMVTSPTYLGGLGFSNKWNMGWMNDTLKYMEMDPIYRKHHHNLITFSFMYAFSENFILPLSHDEVVHGKKSLLDKMSGDEWQRFASLRLLYSYYMIHPGKKLLFMGGEFGQGLEWRYAYGLEWQLLDREQHAKTKVFVKELNNLYRKEKALYEIDNSYEGFDFIDPHNEDQSIVTLMRKGKDEGEFIIGILNFTPVVYYDYKVGVPYLDIYEEVFNSDDEKYWGSNQTMKNTELYAIDNKWHNQPYHIKIKVPPLGATFIKLKSNPINNKNE
ncbi:MULTISPECIES: 1,4-alpha-glucan branching protein GlgB [Terrisporobacter]|uniref:1,4-alpha-glucan branching enzyme GlgB n=2 Tax=Terrisporobacter TaxID=1505652 RepID=A0A0B3VUS6_9FIRM|nr:1,4-alpha-glucan branching protein GlgB [Terrisporobacter othiniensis]KHS56359.1 1,4-alpha-glucan branching protein [Terrisporobacter othiniensis]MCR1822125.1 1,4-alpha-glucan branching protein GlgB [Terrisporobacter muris]MDU6984644.1 1,4-alpha-glucan branching protein GlgB [Terrisporobacter othiniensis]